MDTKTIHDPFADDDEADAVAASFAPVPKAQVETQPAEQTRALKAADAVADAQGFTQRRKRKKSTFRRSENFRTGRNVGIAIKARVEDVETLAKMVSERQWVKGQALQYALDALQEKINDPQDKFWETHNFHGVD